MKPKISIIFPAYNVAPYLDAALQSIADQSYSNFELIAVDDGSTDDTFDILEKWKQNSNLSRRMTVIHKTNGGLSDARNVGLQHSIGDYIFFMDSDDCIHPNLLELCINFADEKQLDLVQFEHQRMSHNGQLLNDYSNCLPLENRAVVNQEDFIQSFYEQHKNKYYHMTVWSYFIRREVILDNSLSFYKGIIHEDELFTPQVIYFSRRIGYLKEFLYFYRKSIVSITQNHDNRLIFNEKRSQSLKKIVLDMIEFKSKHSRNMSVVYQNFIQERIRSLSGIYIYICPVYKNIFKFIQETHILPMIPFIKTTIKRTLKLNEWSD